jgi:hypothetical protein
MMLSPTTNDQSLVNLNLNNLNDANDNNDNNCAGNVNDTSVSIPVESLDVALSSSSSSSPVIDYPSFISPTPSRIQLAELSFRSALFWSVEEAKLFQYLSHFPDYFLPAQSEIAQLINKFGSHAKEIGVIYEKNQGSTEEMNKEIQQLTALFKQEVRNSLKLFADKIKTMLEINPPEVVIMRNNENNESNHTVQFIKGVWSSPSTEGIEAIKSLLANNTVSINPNPFIQSIAMNNNNIDHSNISSNSRSRKKAKSEGEEDNPSAHHPRATIANLPADFKPSVAQLFATTRDKLNNNSISHSALLAGNNLINDNTNHAENFTNATDSLTSSVNPVLMRFPRPRKKVRSTANILNGRRGFSSNVIQILNDWFEANVHDPYPSSQVKEGQFYAIHHPILCFSVPFANPSLAFSCVLCLCRVSSAYRFNL